MNRLLKPLACLMLASLLLSGCNTTPWRYSPDKAARLVARQQHWGAAQALAGIDTGPRFAPTALVVLFDPNCPSCTEQFRELKPYLQQVRIHWVPIGLEQGTLAIGSSCRQVPPSLYLSATLLAQVRSRAALLKNEEHYDAATCQGGFHASPAAPAWALRAARHNADAVSLFKAYGVPLIIYPTADGGYATRPGVTGGSELAALVSTAKAAARASNPRPIGPAT